MNNTPTDKIISIHQQQKAFFKTGATLEISFRKAMLKKLLCAMDKWESKISEALWTDLHKSYQEAFLTEISIVKGELRTHLRKVSRWARKKRVATPIKLFPSSTNLVKEPLGCSLIISPWNYPVQLLLNPLVGAISSGCTAMLKPSPYVPNVSKVIEDMITETFDEKYIAVVQGNRDVNTALLGLRWDMIFFTGSPALAKTVMAAAAKNLTPVILELGGKSPCIIDKTADIAVTAKRLAWGKTLNSGQTCIAPDYILVDKRVEERFAQYLVEAIEQLYGEDPISSPDYGSIVNEKHYNRLINLIDIRKTYYGGVTDPARLKLSPTVLRGVTAEDAVMQEEIFGPIFPIIPVETMAEAEDFVLAREKPLALYLFTKRKIVEERFLQYVSFGGGCVNDTIMHIASTDLPFGGVGNSGMGSYHGIKSFETFSHQKSVLKKACWLDLPLRYPPYQSKLVAKLLRIFLR